MADPKLLLWDIESTGLNADFGIILCIGWKWYGQKKVNIIRIDNSPTYPKDRGDDKYVVEEFIKILEQADMQVTWYGKRFDEPFLRSRMVFHGIAGNIVPVPHIDLWETARKEFKLSSNRLKSVQSFLDLPDEKTEVKGRIWLDAITGKQSALKYIVDHCRKDILVLEEAYERMRPIIRANRPNMRVVKDETKRICPVCGGNKLKSWGWRITLTTKYRRYRCMDCLGWSSAPEKQPDKTR